MMRLLIFKSDGGSITVVSAMLILLLSGLLILFAQIGRLSIIQMDDRGKLLLCTKRLINSTKKYVTTIEKMNHIITLINLGKIVSIPSLPFPIPAGFENGIDAVKFIQNSLHVSYMKKTLMNIRRECDFHIDSGITPFKTENLVILSRNQDETVKKERKEWMVTTKRHAQKLNVTFRLDREFNSEVKE